jgi:hypothetical protein
MSFKPQTCVIALSVCSLFGVMPALAQENPTTDQAAEPQANAYKYPDRYAGDAVYGKRAATSDQYQFFYETYRKRGYNFAPLRDGYVDVTVPATYTHLVNIAFSAECRLFDKDKDKYKKFTDSDALLIRVFARRHLYGSTYGPPVYASPSDGHQAFCSDDSYATHKGNWVALLGEGTWRIHVSFLVFDKHRNDKLFGYIDDWTLEAVSYINGRRVY